MTRQLLAIEGLRCDHCVHTVDTAIRAVPGVSACQVDLAAQTAEVHYDATVTTPAALVQAVRQAGYKASTEASQPTGTSAAARSLTQLNVATSAPTAPSSSAPAEAGSENAPTQVSRWLLDIDGMHCASCVSRVEDALRHLRGVDYGRANLATNQASVVVGPDGPTLDEVIRAIEAAGYQAQPAASAESAAEAMRRREAAQRLGWRRRFLVALALLVPLLLVAHFWQSDPPWLAGLVQLLLATPIQLYVGWPYLIGAAKRLRQRSTNMDTLVALGTTTAYVTGVVALVRGQSMLTFHDAAMILTFITLGKYLEAKAKGRASSAILALLDLAPDQATVQLDQRVVEVPVADVQPGQTIIVRPGQRVPLDATVAAGHQRRRRVLADRRVAGRG